MSDSEQPSTSKTTAIPTTGGKTSAVPLKKETVRITLRARPGAGVTQPREATSPVSVGTSPVPSPTTGTNPLPPPAATPTRSTAPIALPSAPLPPPSAKATTNPVSLPPAPIPAPGRRTGDVPPRAPAAPAPSIPAPAPTISAPRPPAPAVPAAPPRPAAPAAPSAAPRPPVAPGAAAPRPPVAPGGAARVETGAATQPLQAAPRPMAPRPPGAGTAPMGTGATSKLPQATQKLQPGGPMQRPAIAAPQSAPVKRPAAVDSQQFYEEKDPEAGLVPLSVVCFVLALILLGAQITSTDLVMSSPPSEESGMLVPERQNPNWEKFDELDRTYTNTFSQVLPTLPE